MSGFVSYGSYDSSAHIRAMRDEVLRYPMVKLIRSLFPDIKISHTGLMCSPLRDDVNPSFSVFSAHGGISKAKDHATKDVYDNISFFRAVYPQMSFMEALDRLCWISMGHGVWPEGGCPSDELLRRPRAVHHHVMEPEAVGALRLDRVLPLSDVSVPGYMRDFWRSRGISDANIFRTCVYAGFTNLNRQNAVSQDAVGLYNDRGYMVLRVPDNAPDGGNVRKFTTKSFLTTIYADGSRPSYPVWFEGRGDGRVSRADYDYATCSIIINGTQRFCGVSPYVTGFAVPFVAGWLGRELDYREAYNMAAVLTSMNGPVNGRCVVVEGMFDGLSWNELQGGTFAPGCDLVILNSVTNINWAVPFLSMENEVDLLLDNDLGTGAGQKACDELVRQIEAFRAKTGSAVRVNRKSAFFAPYKDLNEYLIARKFGPKNGLPAEERQEACPVKVKKSAVAYPKNISSTLKK